MRHLFLILSLFLLFPACRRDEAARPQIGVVLLQDDQFFRMVERAMRETAAEAGIGVSIETTRNSPNEESRLIDSYQVRRMKAIVVSPCSREGSVESLRQAHERGIKIVTFDTPLAADFPLCYVESNQYELGRSTGERCRAHIEAKLGGKAKLAILAYMAINPESSGQRIQGFKDQVAKLPGVEIVAEQDAWMPPEGDRVAGAILTKHRDLDIIWAANEGGTVGAVTAVAGAGRAGKVAVFGTDISRQLADFLLADDNVLQATTAQQPEQIGRLAMRAALDVLAGKTMEKTIRLPGVLFDRDRPEEVRAYKK